MPWVMDLSGHQAWASEAMDALRAASSAMETVDAPVNGAPAGIVLSASDSPDLLAALAAAEYGRSRVMVIGPPGGTLKRWPVLDAGAAECLAWHGQVAAILAWLQRTEEIESVLESSQVREKLTGQSPALRSVLRDLVVAARFGNAPVLIQSMGQVRRTSEGFP